MMWNIESFFKKMVAPSLSFFENSTRLKKVIKILTVRKKRKKIVKLIMHKLGGIFYVGFVVWMPISAAIGFSDDINYSRLYDSAKSAHPGQERLIRDESMLKSKAVRFSEVLGFIREHVPGGRSCFISHAFNPMVSEVERERHHYQQNTNLFDYYDQFYRFLGVSLWLSGFDTLCDLLADDPRLGIRENDRAVDFCRRAGDVNHAIVVFVPYYKERYAVAGSGVRVEFDCMAERQTRDLLNLHYYAPLLLDGNPENAIPETETPLRGRLFQRFTVQDREENRFFYDDFFALLQDRLMMDHQEIINQARQFFDNPEMPMPEQRRASLTFEQRILELQRGMANRAERIEDINRLNRDLVVTLSTMGSQRIANFCNTLIAGHRNSIDDLRRSFRQISSTLRNLSAIPLEEPMRFVAELERFMNTDEIRGVINQIAFLKTLNDERRISFETREWARAFDTIRGQIDSLSCLPECRYDAQTQTICVASVLLGTSDIQRIFEDHPRVSSIYAFAWNTVFFDLNMRNHGESLVFPGKSLVLIAPVWKAFAPCLIDLSGVNGRNGDSGAPGEDGRPGSPGQNGGHFFGKSDTFEGSVHLTINTSGGHGGNGGQGGDGANGENGVDGDLTLFRAEAWRSNNFSGRRHGHYGMKYQELFGVSKIYEGKGTDGFPGLNGGRGGRKGFGGLPGRISGLHIDHLTHRSLEGSIGQDGSPGNGGTGGVHGRHCIGRVIEEIIYRDMKIINDGKIKLIGSGSKPDRVEIPPSHLACDLKSASNGEPGSGLSDVASTPSAWSPELNAEDILREYREGYEQARRDDFINRFVEPFLNI